MIEVRNVNKRFGKLEVLREVNATFQKGGSYAIVGPNGSGKTTLIKSILGMVLPDSGTIEVDGESVRGHWSYRERIGYMPQIGRYPDNIKIGQLLTMIRDLRGTAKATDDELVHELRLDELSDKRMHTLSGGTRQKVSAAISFLFDPAVLILDEPTAGLDPLSVEILKAKILKEKERGKVFLITSHIMSDLDELSSHILYIEEGIVRYDNMIAELKRQTGEEKLGRAIAGMMRNNFKANPS
ncbi:MAG: ABC transporter ATP-binding protein [Cyclobacteriaceae bacterium]|nr:ABC transporter ATP-binding protein [Cyclobacteriaceae bacterium]